MKPDSAVLSSTPSLYVVATPLGNLADLSARAASVLAEVDVVAAEDTRHSQRLLDAIGVRARMVALHEHNEQSAAGGVIKLLNEGRNVALISDAGTPGVSDPGARCVARVREAGFPVVPVPGACAAIAALSVAGFTESGFRFVGFLPPKSAARRTALEVLAAEPVPLVMYESPHRIAECMDDLLTVLGPEREVLIAREMTKLHEQIVRLPLCDAPAWLAGDSDRVRGEFVLVVSAAPPRDGLDAESERVLGVLLEAVPLKQAAQLASEITGVARKALYARALELKNR